MLTALIIGSMTFSCSSGKSAGTDNASAPVPIKVYSAEKVDYIMSETVIKTKEEWKKLLTPEQYHILREKGTERAYTGKYADHHEHGIYRCAVGGHKKTPTYKEVSSGRTGHAEAVQVVYDPAKVSYEKLLPVFWHNIDPTVRDRQFCDTGHQYRSAIFYHNEQQRQLALQSKELLSSGQRIWGMRGK